MRPPTRHWRLVVALAAIASAGAVAVSTAATSTTGSTATTSSIATTATAKLAPLPAGTTTSTSTLDADQRARLRTEVDGLVSTWADAGGGDGFPYWEKQFRAATTRDPALRALVAATSANDLDQYTDAYLQLLRSGRSDIDDAPAHDDLQETHRHLRQAIVLRIAALESLRTMLRRAGAADQQAGEAPFQPLAVLASSRRCSADDDCAAFLDQLDRSYRETRLATTELQAVLAAAGEPPIPESSFT